MLRATASLKVCTPTSNCSAPGGNFPITSRNASGRRSGIISKWTNNPGRLRARKNSRIARLAAMFRLNVLSTNLNCLAPRSSSRSISPRNAARGNCRTGTSSEERQNSQVNGQPRDAST